MTAPESSLAQQLETIERMVRNEARQALSLARDLLADAPLDDDLVYERLRLAKGAAQARLGETADGARLMREVKVWAEDNDETELLAMCHRQLSMLFRRVGDPALMLEHAVSAVELLADDCDEALRAEHLLGLADALGASSEYDSSIRRYEEAGALAERCDDTYLRHAVLNNLAFTLFEAGLSEEAVATSERLLEEVAESGQPILTHIGDTVARSYMAVGRYADASVVLAPLCEIPESDEDCDGLALALLTLAEAKRLGADLDSARAALDRASNLIEEFSLEGHRAAVLREQGELFAAAGDYESAFTTYKAFHESEMALRALERDGRARTLNAIFEATEAQRSRDYFRELATRDPLTGLHNRRHLDASLTELLDSLDGSAGHVTVGLIDLDHFKRVNDTYSHAIGDAVLQRVAGILEQVATAVEGGVAARMGGEEFVLVLPHLTASAAVPEFEQLRVSLAEEPWCEIAAGLAVTASIGVGSAPEDGTDKGELLAVADRNLYRAKNAGRNRVVS
ncbi:MAG: GGDEF domain-containing protein [Nocardioides sp.]